MKNTSILIFMAAAVFGSVAQAEQQQLIIPDYLKGVGFDQKLNAQTPLDTSFTDESGQQVRLRQVLRGRPAILALVYYTCPMLCDQIMRGVVHGLRPLSFEPVRDFDVIAISINPKETPDVAAAKRKEYVSLYGRNASPEGWRFLTGSETSIRAVADAVGFRYRYDPKSGMFIHAAGVMVLTPEGRVSRYLYGVEYEPKDLKLGLIEASHRRIGSPVDKVLLFCYHYDASAGKYTATVLNLVRLAGGGFLMLLITGLAVFWVRDLRARGIRHEA